MSVIGLGMYSEGFAIITVYLAGIFCLVGFASGLIMFNYFWELRYHWAPGRGWGRLIPVALFFPFFFTEKGNMVRIKLLQSIFAFLISVLCAYGVSIWNESLRPLASDQAIMKVEN